MNQSLPALSVAELSALNDEMIALTRANVPLPAGLRDLSGDLPGKVGRAAGVIGQRLEAGERLDEIFSSGREIPTVYAAIVEAGLRSGRLPAALESIASVLQRVSELRRIFAASLVYPFIVVTMAYGLTLFTLANLNVTSLQTFQSLGAKPTPAIELLDSAKATMTYWAPLPLIVLGVVMLFMYFRYAAAPASVSMRSYQLPTIRRMVRDGRIYAFLEVLTLLLEHRTPLDEAVVLAGNASGERSLAAAAEQLASRIRDGQPLESLASVPAGFPPLLGWLLLTCNQQSHLLRSLHRLSTSYRLRANRTAAFLSIYYPLLVSGILGGSATLAYGVIALGPWYQLLYRIGMEP